MSATQPRVVFHATDREFDAFRTPAWFALSVDDAKMGGVEPGRFMVYAVLDVQNPRVLDDAEMDEFRIATGASLAKANRWAKRRLEDALDEGFDGLELPGYAIVVADPAQIRIVERLDTTATAGPAATVGRQHPTDNPNFVAWFSQSKVVDHTGAPLVVYHGTAADFHAFDATKVGSKHVDIEAGDAFYFSNDVKTANWYAKDSAKQNKPKAGAAVMPVYLSMQNPRIEDFMGEGIEYLQEAIETAKKNGNDGLIAIDYADGTASDHYIVFSPGQIKSAIGNTGAFNRANPDITDQRAMQAGEALAFLATLTHGGNLDIAVSAIPADKSGKAVPDAVPTTMASEESCRAAAMVSDQYREDEPGHADPKDLVWIEVAHYPISRLKDAVDAEWFAAEQTMWADEGEADRFDDMLDGPILTPVVVHDDGQGGWTWDGNHRIGATLSKGISTIAATVGLPRELFNALMRNPDLQSVFGVIDPQAAGARAALDWLDTQQPVVKAVPRV